jgi:excisionase family DNA binding protein
VDTPSKPYLTVEDIAVLLDVGVDTVRNWINRKHDPLPAYKVGREWRIKREDFERFMQDRKNTSDN